MNFKDLNEIDDLHHLHSFRDLLTFQEEIYNISIPDYYFGMISNKYPFQYRIQTLVLNDKIDLRFYPICKNFY